MKVNEERCRLRMKRAFANVGGIDVRLVLYGYGWLTRTAKTNRDHFNVSSDYEQSERKKNCGGSILVLVLLIN